MLIEILRPKLPDYEFHKTRELSQIKGNWYLDSKKPADDNEDVTL